jgi:hypothetical protein
MGNPPFIGQYTKAADQTADMKSVWGSHYDGYLDYVTAWFAKAVDLFSEPGYGGEFAYVSTNSITQGQPVPALFSYIFSNGWRIKFAHRTFAWESEAPGAAAVHCVITGYYKSNRRIASEVLYSYPNIKGDPNAEPVKDQINGYLIDGPNVLVIDRPQGKTLGKLPQADKGAQPTDGTRELAKIGKQSLIIDANDYDIVMSDPIAAKYIHPFVGAEELIQGKKRWCLWLENLEPSDLKKSDVLRQRIENCRDWRTAQTQSGDAYKLKDVPHLFRKNRQPATPYVCVPRHVSETRRFFTVAHLDPIIICGDANNIIDDPDGFAFAVLSSSAFITWQRAIGGRLESRLRFSNTLTWNTFPLPDVTDAQRAVIIAGGKAVLEARQLHPNRSLADHYNPLAMAPELLKAHTQLDKAVDAVFGLKNPTNEQRLAALFKSYQQMTAAEQLPIPTKPKHSATGHRN